MNKPILGNRYKNLIIKIIKINIKLVYPVHDKGGASVINPQSPDDSQDQRETGTEEAQDLVGEAHGLGHGQSRVPHLQNTLASRQSLLKAAVFSNQILIKNKGFSFSNK
jgi:hypothetical protein